MAAGRRRLDAADGMTGTCAACGATFVRPGATRYCRPCADQRDAERSHRHFDLSPDAIEARYQAALAAIKARDRRVDPWEQRPGYEGPEVFTPLASELPSYRETEKARKVYRQTPRQWNRNPA